MLASSKSIGKENEIRRLPESAHIGKVRLAVSSLHRSVDFYTRIIGLTVRHETLSSDGYPLASLGAQGGGPVLLELEERPGVQPIHERSRLGLYHTAFLLSTRLDLALFVGHLREKRVEFAAGEHLVSEAIYLVDPDGLEVEVYADRPRDQWPWENGQLRMGTYSVRFAELAALAAASSQQWQGAPSGTTIGHVHFYIGDLREAQAFYCSGLGFDVMVAIPSALFVAAGGYHHHVGLNIWAAGSPAASQKDARLLFWEFVLPDSEAVNDVADRLLAAKIPETANDGRARCFTDSCGIAVQISAESPSVQ